MEKRRKVVDEAQAVDRISELPDSLCHEILRHLPATDARITGLLSRRWRLIWYSCPFYNFDEGVFRSSVFSRVRFSTFIIDTLRRHKRYSQNSKLQFLRLSMLPNLNYRRRVLNRSLILSQIMDVKELHLVYGGILPSQVLISKSITILKLTHYSIESSYPINMPALKTLDLYEVGIFDDGLEKLLSNCPSIENLSLTSLLGSLSVNISTHKLKYLLLRSIFQKARIEAPNLEILDITGLDIYIQLEIASSTRLRLLTLCSTFDFLDEVLEDIVLQNPHLEKLELRNCFGLKHTSIHSQNLRHLMLHNCQNLAELNIYAPQLQTLGLIFSFELVNLSIDAPHLRRFTYEGNLMCLSKLNATHLFDSHIIFYCLSSYEQWYNRLKQVLEKFEKSRVLTLAFLEDKQLVVPGEIRESLSVKLYGVHNLKVEIQQSTMNYSELLDGLRWSFPHLKTLEIEICNPVAVYNKYCQTAGDVGTESIWKYMGFSDSSRSSNHGWRN